MATTKFVNRARMTTDTTGTGSSVNLVVAVPKYFTFSEAGLQDGDVVDYIIEDGDDFEIQHDQTYSSSGPSLSRGTPAASKVSGTAGTSKINLSGGAQVAIVGLAKSFDVSTFTEKSSPDPVDLLWGHSDADGARRAIPISGVLGLVRGLELLDSGTVSNAANLDVVLTGYSAYRGLVFKIINLVPSTNDAKLNIRVSSNGGASFDSGGSDYAFMGFHGRTANVGPHAAGSGAASSIPLGDYGVSNSSANGGIVASVEIMDHAGSGRKLVNAQGAVWTGANNNLAIISVVGARLNTQVINAVRFYFSSGDISSGAWALYGYK